MGMFLYLLHCLLGASWGARAKAKAEAPFSSPVADGYNVQSQWAEVAFYVS